MARTARVITGPRGRAKPCPSLDLSASSMVKKAAARINAPAPWEQEYPSRKEGREALLAALDLYLHVQEVVVTDGTGRDALLAAALRGMTLDGFLAAAHVGDAVFALRPDYRAMLLGRRTSQRDIRRQRQGPDNRITSDRVGEARIVYGGRGTIARSNAMGWLGRFFNSAAFPY